MNPLKTTFEEKLMQNYADIVNDYRSKSKRGLEYHLKWIYVYDENMTPEKLKAMQIFAFAVNRFLKEEVRSSKRIKLRKHNVHKLKFNKEIGDYEWKYGWNFQVVKKPITPKRNKKHPRYEKVSWNDLPIRHKNLLKGEIMRKFNEVGFPAYPEFLEYYAEQFYNNNNIIFKTDYHGKIKNN